MQQHKSPPQQEQGQHKHLDKEQVARRNKQRRRRRAGRIGTTGVVALQQQRRTPPSSSSPSCSWEEKGSSSLITSPSKAQTSEDEDKSKKCVKSLVQQEEGLHQLTLQEMREEEVVNILSSAIKRSPFDQCVFLSKDERFAIAEAVIDVLDFGTLVDSFAGEDSETVGLLCDFLDITPNEALSILGDAFCCLQNAANESKGGGVGIGSKYILEEDLHSLQDDDKTRLAAMEDDELSTESEDAYLKPGECELCERETKLTLHHLLPKSTWKVMKQRFLQAAIPYRQGDFEKVKQILDLGDELPEKLLPGTFSCGNSIKLFLAGHTAALCRPCHNCIHANHDNMELAEKFNTIEKLLGDERIYKFCKWQNKQKPSKYAKR
jgi:hypothetical protein